MSVREVFFRRQGVVEMRISARRASIILVMTITATYAMLLTWRRGMELQTYYICQGGGNDAWSRYCVQEIRYTVALITVMVGLLALVCWWFVAAIFSKTFARIWAGNSAGAWRLRESLMSASGVVVGVAIVVLFLGSSTLWPPTPWLP